MSRPRKKQPVTIERAERALDILAWIMSWSKNAHLGVPLYRKLEEGLAELRDNEEVMAAARERFKRSQDQTEARSS